MTSAMQTIHVRELQAEQLRALTLEQLMAEATKLGRIHLYQSKKGAFSFTIEFETIPGCNLEAESGFGHETISSAVIASIEKAMQIKGQFK